MTLPGRILTFLPLIPQGVWFHINQNWRRKGNTHVKISQKHTFYEHKFILFKIGPFHQHEYRRQIKICMTLKIKVDSISNKWHFKNIESTISDSLLIHESIGTVIWSFRQTLTLPSIVYIIYYSINYRAVVLVGVYVVIERVFFFWQSPITYHYLNENDL